MFLQTDVKNLQPETETMILISMFHIAVISALLRHACHSCLLREAFFRWGKKQAYSFFKIIIHVFFLNLEHLMLQRWPTYLQKKQSPTLRNIKIFKEE